MTMEKTQEPKIENKQLASLMATTGHVAYIKDQNGRFVYVNQHFGKQFNMKPGDISGKTDFDYLPENQAQQLTANDKDASSQNGRVIEFDETVPGADGVSRQWKSFKFAIRSSNGQQWVGGISVEANNQQQVQQIRTNLQKLLSR